MSTGRPLAAADRYRLPLTVVTVGLLSIAVLIGTAYGVSWIKSQPWRDRAPKSAPQPQPTQDRVQPVPAE